MTKVTQILTKNRVFFFSFFSYKFEKASRANEADENHKQNELVRNFEPFFCLFVIWWPWPLMTTDVIWWRLMWFLDVWFKIMSVRPESERP